MMTIAIVGGGAVGVATLNHLVHELREHANARIVVYEMSHTFGPGQAYGEHNGAQLLNRTTETMSVVHGDDELFHRWCVCHAAALQAEFPEFEFRAGVRNEYLPRRLFGRHIADVLASALVEAARRNVRVDLVSDEIVAIHPQGGIYRLRGRAGAELVAHAVVLAIGNHGISPYAGLNGASGYIPSAYPAARLAGVIPKHASVGIIGSRLSAVDAVLALADAGHTGKIVIASRTGLLPSVKVDAVDASARQYWGHVAQRLRLCRGSLSLRKIRDLVTREVSRRTGAPARMQDWFKRPRDPADYLRSELAAASRADTLAWQSVWSAMNTVVELLWHELPLRDKRLFLSTLHSKWMSLRVGIPARSARSLLALLEQGRLEVVKGLCDVRQEASSGRFGLVNNHAGRHRHVDFVVNATGSTDKVSKIDSPLLRQLLADRVIAEHELGGIAMSFRDSALIDADGRHHPRFYAVGRLTSGTYLFTSVLELNVRHACRIARQLAGHIAARSSPSADSSFASTTHRENP